MNHYNTMRIYKGNGYIGYISVSLFVILLREENYALFGLISIVFLFFFNFKRSDHKILWIFNDEYSF